MTPPALRRVIESLYDPLGPALLAYLFACSESELTQLDGSIELTHERAVVAAQLLLIVDSPLPPEVDEANRQQILRALVIQADEQGMTVARRLHEQAGGAGVAEWPPTEVEAALAHLAWDSYPAFLLPPEEHLPIQTGEVNVLATSLLFRHPASKLFEAAVLEDDRLSPLFAEHPATGWTTLIHRSTGSGGGLQLALLPDLLLRNAWRSLSEDARSPASFTAGALEAWHLVRDVLSGKPRSITARFAFTGVLLPTGAGVEIGGGLLREATERDRDIAPPSLKSQLSSTDASGATTTINYDGDVVFEIDVPFKVAAQPPPPAGENVGWPKDIQPSDTLPRTLTKLRASLTLATRREHRVQLVPTWQQYDDPLAWGYALSWFDPQSAVGLVPTTLTQDEVAEWGRWYKLLETKAVDRIDVALNRALRAIGERREPSDVLIDSVIAWENLFGTPEGEPTLRVSVALALLLAQSPDERPALRRTFSDIYRLRSQVVHGNRALGPSDYPLCYEALETALRALRVLLEERRDVLELSDGAARSLRLILEA